MQRKIDVKVTPEVYQSILLDEIAGRLADIHAELQAQVPEGHIYSQPLTVMTIPQKVVFMYSATIYNDGADDLYILEENRSPASWDTPIKATESLVLDFKKRGQFTKWLVTLSGTATVRILALR